MLHQQRIQHIQNSTPDFKSQTYPPTAFPIPASVSCFLRTFLITWSFLTPFPTHHVQPTNLPTSSTFKKDPEPNPLFLPLVQTSSVTYLHLCHQAALVPCFHMCPLHSVLNTGHRAPLDPTLTVALPQSNPSKGCSPLIHSEPRVSTIGFRDACRLTLCISSLAQLQPCTYKSSACSQFRVSTDCRCLDWNSLPEDNLVAHSHISPSCLHGHVNLISEVFSSHNIKWAIPHHFPNLFFSIGLTALAFYYIFTCPSPQQNKSSNNNKDFCALLCPRGQYIASYILGTQ